MTGREKGELAADSDSLQLFCLDYAFLNLESKIQLGCLIRIHINVSKKLIG